MLVSSTFFGREAAGAHQHPAFPAPSVFRGTCIPAKLGQLMPRERGGVFVIARSASDEAIQPYKILDRFAYARDDASCLTIESGKSTGRATRSRGDVRPASPNGLAGQASPLRYAARNSPPEGVLPISIGPATLPVSRHCADKRPRGRKNHCRCRHNSRIRVHRPVSGCGRCR
jgi:hypothetical protein